MTDAIDILLVDDEPRNLDVLEAILDDPAYRLLRAEHADHALKLLLEHDVAAIVLDIKMPGMSGFELAQVIKSTKKFRQVPILFLTAYLIEDQDVIAGYGAGAVDYLTKPVNPQIFRHKVAVFADLFRKTRALAELNNRLEERVRERTAELERSEAALRAAATQKDEFLAILAHELRNPLAPLRTGLDLLLAAQQRGVQAPERTLAAMNRQLDHMVRLIDDLLDISRISRGVLELKNERIDLADVVRTAIDNARPFFDRRRQVVASTAPGGVFAVADATRVAQILGNLLHNAAKFTPDGGRIEVALAQAADHARIEVTDSGVGIPPEQIERVFDMFARVDRLGARAEQGLGIGLALARRIAELHAGTLTATSGGDGHGATFVLSLPALRAAEPAAAPGRSATPLLDGAEALKILVIEDNNDIADTLADLLSDLGHRVWVARNGPDGVALVKDALPNVVLCDLGLPGMDGVEVCRSVRGMALSAQPVMVALTGWGRDDDRRRTSEAGFDHHLVKPVASDKLHAVLRTVRA
ncbi:MAG TPA: response regulator [Kofleriaceae bacterium]|nr:response regulator [Kofleriaceae bacterium]